MALHRQGKWDAAVDCYCQAIAHQPSAPRYFNLGVAYDQQGQLDEAVRCYSQAIALAPDYANAYSNLGCVWLKQGKLSDAIAIFQQAIARMPTASLHNNLGQALYADGQLDAAIAAYRRAIHIQPDLAQAHFNLGCLWQQQRRDSEAIACFQRVIQHDSDRVAAYSRCGQLLFDQGRVSQALTVWQQAIARQPTFVDAYCRHIDSTAQSSDALDQARAACVQFLTALRHTPIGHEAPRYLAQTYHRLGDLLASYGGIEQAETYYRKALQIEPHTVELYPKLGDCLARQQRFDAALMVYHIALMQQPNYPGLHARIGYSLEQQQRFQQAIGYYQTELRSPDATPIATIPWDRKSSLSVEVPTRIYHSTQAWVTATQQDGVTYVPVGGSGQQRERLGDRHTRHQHQGHNLNDNQPDCILLDAPFDAMSDPQCGGVTCQPCMARLRSEFEPVQFRDGVYRCSRTTPLDGLHPPTFVVTIPNGRAWIAPQQNSWMICNGIAIITPDGALLSDLSRSYPWYLPGCDRHDPRRHRLFHLDNPPPVEHISGRVAVLSGLSGHVYYHWMVDVLPRFEILRQGKLDLTEVDYFVVNNINQSFQRDTLAMLGLSPKKLICSDRHPHIQADHLIVPSFPGLLDWVPLETLTVLRQMFLNAVDSTPDSALSDCPSRLYISRSKARYRHVLNEAEVIDQLQPLGFVPVVLESLPVNRQIELFAHADIIISPHGAGLTNLIFCKTGTQVVELTSPHYVRTDYWVISHQLGLSHYFIQGEKFECDPLRQIMYQNPLTEDILISKQSLHTVMQYLAL